MKRILPAFAAATLILAPFIRADDATAASATPPPAAPAPLDSSATPTAPVDLKAQHHAEMIKRFDTNGDGVLDANERAAMHTAMQQKRAERLARMNERMLKKYDKNGDGVLDASEQAAALADLENRPRFIARFDKDGDGKLNDVEKANAENTMRALWTHQQATAATGTP
ncbi:MAG TPA: EF-hand domain-containing protein [Opitutaceae bacterium]